MKEKKKRFKHEHGSSFSVDYYAYASHMRSWNAGFKVLFSIISLLICIACNNLFVSLAVIFFMGFLTVAVGGLDLHHYITMLLVPIVFLIFGTIAIAIAILMAGCVIGTALAQGMAASKTMEAIARQPEMAGQLRSTLILALGLMESLAIYGLLIAFMLIGKM